MAPPTTVLMLPTTALCRQQKRCVTLKDARFVDGADTPSSTPSIMSPTSNFTKALSGSLHGPVSPTTSVTIVNAASLRAPVVRPAKRRCHTVTSSAFTVAKAEQVGSGDDCQHGASENALDDAEVKRRPRRSKTLGADVMKEVSVCVIAPGGGTGINASVYATLAKKEGVSVKILGQSRAPYDRYPASWAKEGGAPAPNLESFALDLLADKSLDKVDCLVVGSRGGQVVLPTFWNAKAASIPPVIVMNGGCAMNLPIAVHWPETAVSFLLLGGQDYFRGQTPISEYVKDAQRCVPQANSTTAILFVHEMTHMPQTQLLGSILHYMIRAATSWKRSGDVPSDEFQMILANLRKGGWTGKLTFKTAPGNAWQHEAFP